MPQAVNGVSIIKRAIADFIFLFLDLYNRVRGLGLDLVFDRVLALMILVEAVKGEPGDDESDDDEVRVCFYAIHATAPHMINPVQNSP